MTDFFQRLNFTSANEDGRSELAALSGVTGRVLCLTGSGARPLDLLLGPAAEVVALDLNPAQNALLRLKMAGFAQLNHLEMLEFMGVTPCTDRLAHYQKLRSALAPDDAAFWDARVRILRRGVIYAGLWERVLRFGAFGTRLIRGRHLRDLMAAPDTPTQAAIWQAQFDDRIWRGAIRLLARRWIWTKVIGEPGGAYLPPPDVVEARLAGAFTRASARFLFRESDFASLILTGRIGLPDALPLHLRPEYFDHIRTGLHRITPQLGGLGDLKAAGAGRFDGFSLSDFGSYCDADRYAGMWRAVLAVATPGAAFCERIFMNELPLPDPRIRPDAALSERLTRDDRAIIYLLRAGRIGAAA